MLNYTTKIDPAKTVGEIQQILSRQGARKIVIDYDDNHNPIAITFVVKWNQIPTLFALPCRWEGTRNALSRMSRTKKVDTSAEHARRVAWRVLKDWVEAQMAIIEAGVVTLPEVFLPYAVTKNGKTMYELTTVQHQQLLLPTAE